MRILSQHEIHAISGGANLSNTLSPITGPVVYIAAILYKLLTGKTPSWFQIDL